VRGTVDDIALDEVGDSPAGAAADQGRASEELRPERTAPFYTLNTAIE